MPGFQDPKSGGDIFGNLENVTPTQFNKILANQRHNQFKSFMAWRQSGIVASSEPCGSRVEFCVFASGAHRYAYWMATPALSATLVKVSTTGGDFADVAHGQTATAINNITALASRPAGLTWFGLDKDAASSIGYLSFSGSAWALVNRAGSTSAAAVTDMAYSQPLNRIVACWNDATIEYNSVASTWNSVAVSTSAFVVLWGGDEFVALTTDADDFVLWSDDGINWDEVAVPVTMTSKLLAYDVSEDVWYILSTDASGSTLVLLTASSPGSSWAQVPSVDNPMISILPIESFVVNGGVIAIAHNRAVYVSGDLGQTWSMGAAGGLGGEDSYTNYLRFAGGRLFCLNNDANNGGTVFIAEAAFPPYQDPVG